VNRPPRVLQVYNEYRRYGGEDVVVLLEADLLRQHGHEVELLRVSTKELGEAGPLRLVAAALGTVWSFRGYSAMKNAIAAFSPDVVHVHNDFPLLSPSIFWACDRAGIPVVHTMHNYRFACANAVLLRNDRPCEDCVGRFPWPALRHRCYGSTLPRTAAVAARNVIHRWLGTYKHQVHAYVALTGFSKDLLVRAGLPQERIFVKPNFQFVPQPPVLPRQPRFVFAGWMVREKGLHLLLQAWQGIRPVNHELLIIGDGSERAVLEPSNAKDAGIVWLGPLPRQKVFQLVLASRYAVVPSLCYENFPMSVLEALSAGTPLIAPDHGAFSRILSNDREGLLFSAGDAASLENALRAALAAPASVWTQWSINARNKFLREYTEQENYTQLKNIYEKAIAFFQQGRAAAARRKPSKAVAGVASEVQGDS
jgi:glycosyltransferase involved in cell wall biosynthesis